MAPAAFSPIRSPLTDHSLRDGTQSRPVTTLPAILDLPFTILSPTSYPEIGFDRYHSQPDQQFITPPSPTTHFKRGPRRDRSQPPPATLHSLVTIYSPTSHSVIGSDRYRSQPDQQFSPLTLYSFTDYSLGDGNPSSLFVTPDRGRS
jgi:hypothetical protein